MFGGMKKTLLRLLSLTFIYPQPAIAPISFLLR